MAGLERRGYLEITRSPPAVDVCHPGGRPSLSPGGHSCSDTRSTLKAWMIFESASASKPRPPTLHDRTRSVCPAALSGVAKEKRSPMKGPKTMIPPQASGSRSMRVFRHRAMGMRRTRGAASAPRGPKRSRVAGHHRSPATYMRARARIVVSKYAQAANERYLSNFFM